MKKIAFLLVFWFFAAQTVALANDGVFYAQGNQLIPITETDITVQKEVLTLNRIGDYIEVTVYYEFYNPTGKSKTLLVGFEAAAPYPYEGLGHFPEQPNIHNFMVLMNGKTLPFQVAHVDSELFWREEGADFVPKYYVNGRVQGWTDKQCKDALAEDEMSYPFDYVYHFNAEFKPGVNTVKHTYKYQMSESVDFDFDFPYVLTAACRWANKQIDDFTLNINMGERESFCISPTFTKTTDEWTMNGIGRTDTWEYAGDVNPCFHMREGGVSFHKKNFRPEGELFVFKPQVVWSFWGIDGPILGEDVISVARSTYNDWYILLGEKLDFTDQQKRIMKNMPFAQRGYVFKSKDLQKYFESTVWYIPDPSYVADMNQLPPHEKEIVQFWMK